MSLKNIKMVVDIKDIKLMAWGMAKASSSISKAAIMMANGRIIICMDMANYTILIRN